MRKFSAISAVLMMLGSAVSAGQIQATVINMEETYRDVVKQVPIQNCGIVDVPVYQQQVVGVPKTGDMIAGALLGGVIGNQFGGGSGKDVATFLGAVLGAQRVNNNVNRQQVLTGYRQEQRCETVYQNKNTAVRGDNVVTVRTSDGTQMKFPTQRWYRKGTRINLNVSIDPQF